MQRKALYAKLQGINNMNEIADIKGHVGLAGRVFCTWNAQV
jgi:hypothetical protein